MATLQECQRVTDTFYLGLVLWREARGETRDTKIAVAHSILTRVRHPGWWGRSLVDVITKPWQYSSMTDPHDRQLIMWPLDGNTTWLECLAIATDVIDGQLANPMPGADSYHDISIAPPKWATPDRYVGQSGRIKFYQTTGAQGPVA